MRKVAKVCEDFVLEAIECDTDGNADALVNEIELFACLLERLDIACAELFQDAGSDGCDVENCWRVLDRLKDSLRETETCVKDMHAAVVELESQE